MVNVDVMYRDIDALGRIVLPASWRKHMASKLVLYKIGNEIVIRQRAPNSFRKLKGTLPAGKRIRGLDELKAAGAMDWKPE